MRRSHYLVAAGIILSSCGSAPEEKKPAPPEDFITPEVPIEEPPPPIEDIPNLPKKAQRSEVPPQSDAVTRFQAVAMTVPYQITIGKELSPTEKAQVQLILEDSFAEIDRVFNQWNPNSEISRLNQLPAGKKMPISLELERFLMEVDQVVELTQGRFDPTVLPAQKLWRERLEAGETPKSWEIEALSPAVGWNRVHFGNGLFYKDHDKTEMDLGGIVKGYCVDLLTDRLDRAGFSNAYVEWGGEIRTKGQHPAQRPWRVFISRLGDTDPINAIDTLDLSGQALATSGDYNQMWTVRSADDRGTEKHYFHIVNPRTLEALQAAPKSIASVSVLAPNCMLADALATAGMMFTDAEEAQKWAEGMQRRLQGTAFWIVSRD